MGQVKMCIYDKGELYTDIVLSKDIFDKISNKALLWNHFRPKYFVYLKRPGKVHTREINEMKTAMLIAGIPF